MFTALTLTDFKSFPHAELRFGPITTIIGANATGKSNLRDALKFLHAVGRGMTLPEIFGGKSGVGWPGIRGGAPGTVRESSDAFRLRLNTATVEYHITVASTPIGPLIVEEGLRSATTALTYFNSLPHARPFAKILRAAVAHAGPQPISYPAHQPLLSQVTEVQPGSKLTRDFVKVIYELQKKLENIRFIDFTPDALRQPSVPGEKTISESGDNLSSVLRYLVDDQKKGSVIASWVKALTPMDVARIGFEDYPDGKILAVLEEASGRKVPLSSASDGTLRFLGILASVLSPEAPSLLCFEEIETGLHPVRVQLVSELLQKETADGKPQVLLTTHSPGLLGWLGREHRDHAYLAYRLPETPDTRLKAFRDIPTMEAALEKADAARLFETGWFEEAMFFAEGHPAPIAFVAEDGPDMKP